VVSGTDCPSTTEHEADPRRHDAADPCAAGDSGCHNMSSCVPGEATVKQLLMEYRRGIDEVSGP
jgi:hypothetical protein